MKIKSTWIGLALIALAAYKSVQGPEILEPVLYTCVGIGFILMDAVKNEKLAPYKRILSILSWVFILAGLFLFIALLRQDAYGL